MTPLDTAIHARPAPPPASIVWVHRPERGTWCVLRRATGGRIITLCCDWLDGSARVNILTSALSQSDRLRPHNSCPACETELAVGTPGAATGVEPTVRAAEELFGPRTEVARTATPNDLPRPTFDEYGPDGADRRAVLEHEDLLGDGEGP